MFEPFFTTKNVGEGSGLGLSMVHGFACQSAGSVIIQSTVSTGTAVTLFLPRVTENRFVSVQTQIRTVPKPGTLLPVGDHDAVGSAVSEMLSRLADNAMVVPNVARTATLAETRPVFDGPPPPQERV